MRRALLLVVCSALAACATVRPVAPPTPAVSWDQRVSELQHAAGWQLDGRAAVAVGTQGWQATLNWRQSGMFAEVHLSGPFANSAIIITKKPRARCLLLSA